MQFELLTLFEDLLAIGHVQDFAVDFVGSDFRYNPGNLSCSNPCFAVLEPPRQIEGVEFRLDAAN